MWAADDAYRVELVDNAEVERRATAEIERLCEEYADDPEAVANIREFTTIADAASQLNLPYQAPARL